MGNGKGKACASEDFLHGFRVASTFWGQPFLVDSVEAAAVSSRGVSRETGICSALPSLGRLVEAAAVSPGGVSSETDFSSAVATGSPFQRFILDLGSIDLSSNWLCGLEMSSGRSRLGRW